MSGTPTPADTTGTGPFAAFDRRIGVRAIVVVALLAFALFALPGLVGADWITTFTSVAIYATVALGFGVLYGRVGMISLGQVALLSVGCWVGTRLAYAMRSIIVLPTTAIRGWSVIGMGSPVSSRPRTVARTILSKRRA